MIAINSNKLMDKESAANHFDWLGKIDGAIAALAGEI